MCALVWTSVLNNYLSKKTWLWFNGWTSAESDWSAPTKNQRAPREAAFSIIIQRGEHIFVIYEFQLEVFATRNMCGGGGSSLHSRDNRARYCVCVRRAENENLKP